MSSTDRNRVEAQGECVLSHLAFSEYFVLEDYTHTVCAVLRIN